MNSPLPSHWVDEIFKRFSITWGAQKARAMFSAPEGMGDATDWAEDVHKLWSQQLAGFSGRVLRDALQQQIDAGREWPPTLPEFRAACLAVRQHEARMEADAEQAGLLEHSRQPLSDDARRTLDALKAGPASADPLFWAKRPKSRRAVEMMVVGCQRDASSKLVPILRALLSDPEQAPVRGDDARQALRELSAAPPAFLRPRPVR